MIGLSEVAAMASEYECVDGCDQRLKLGRGRVLCSALTKPGWHHDDDGVIVRVYEPLSSTPGLHAENR